MTSRIPFQDRANITANPLAQQLFQLMASKQTNLALSADVTSADKLLALADQVGPHICVLKTHVDILADFSVEWTEALQALARQHQFMIFEDRKFADIGNTVKHQYAGGMYRIADWAHIVNAHSLPGPGIVAGLAEVGRAKQRGLLLLAEMSSADNLFTPAYTQQTLAMAEAHNDFVIGFIAQHKLSQDPGWIYMTPGIQLTAGSDTLGQRYTTPHQAIAHHESDIIIVGRGIVAATNPKQEAEAYRSAGWDAYLQSL